VLYRGAIGPVNGAREAIRTVPLLAAETTLRLCGPGDPAFLRELEQLAIDEGVRDRVELAGFVPFDELNRQTQRASVGLMLYQPVDTNWTFIATANNKLFEYAACGVPALVPDRQAFQELLGGERFVELVDEKDPRSIGAAVGRILASPEAYEERCRLARRRFGEQFNYERAFQPMLARLLELAAT
jgi:glycosyltransferase involved in cell wall biosynthesis